MFVLSADQGGSLARTAGMTHRARFLHVMDRDVLLKPS